MVPTGPRPRSRTQPPGQPPRGLSRGWRRGVAGARAALLGLAACWAVPACADAPPARQPDLLEDPYDATTEVGMRVLRARLMTQQLERSWYVEVPDEPHAFGGELEAQLVMPNPFGRDCLLLEPAQGYVVELDWRIERWMPYAGSETLRHRQVSALDSLLELAPGDVVTERMTLPLGQPGEGAAVWRVRLAASIRVDGLAIDDEELPVARVRLRGTEFLVLPGNWESLAEDPYGSLERLITMPNPEVDRHVVVAAALLPRARHEQAVGMLIEGFDAAPNLRRIDTMMSALRYITHRDFGENPVLWKRWWHERKMDGS